MIYKSGSHTNIHKFANYWETAFKSLQQLKVWHNGKKILLSAVKLNFKG